MRKAGRLLINCVCKNISFAIAAGGIRPALFLGEVAQPYEMPGRPTIAAVRALTTRLPLSYASCASCF